MAVRPILLFPDTGLKQPSLEIAQIDDEVRALLADMKETLYASPGVALAAPQIGRRQKAIVVDVRRAARPGKPPPKNHGFFVLLNPRIAAQEGSLIFREGCLSVPDFLADVERFKNVRVEGWDGEGRAAVVEAEGFEALALQHEIDHLEGRLFLDRVANLKTDLFRRKTY